jgi:hypothetical protein
VVPNAEGALQFFSTPTELYDPSTFGQYVDSEETTICLLARGLMQATPTVCWQDGKKIVF